MTCARCGREVNDASVVCPYCEKKTVNAQKPGVERFARGAFFPGGLILFLILSFEMIPGATEGDYGNYAIFAGIAAILSAALWLALRKRHTKGAVAALFLIPALLVVSTVGLRATYYIKYDDAVTRIPASGVVPVRFSYEDNYYNVTGTGYVTDWDVSVSIEGARVPQNGVARVELRRQLAVEGVSTYVSEGKTHRATGSANAVLTPSLLQRGYPFDIFCNSDGGEYCEITVTAVYSPDFWDVILD